MRLSVVIVSFNVSHFLRQCLESLRNATREIEHEVFVVDNNSADNTLMMLNNFYPEVKVIANTSNTGFATANNQALRQCTGDYVLLLNPDTIVQEDTIRTCIKFAESHSDCGGIGVKMVNGEGIFLPESRRGFPSPQTSFYKISGLIRLFPHHSRVAAYYCGGHDENETHPCDILTGAFLFMPHKVLEKVGMLDESYFMYGEDIDYSWRIRLAGYKNYYLPTTRIIHYKGESTKKGSINYVRTFYEAMSIFVRRYFSGKGRALYNTLIHLAIYARAALALCQRAIQRALLPAIDVMLSIGAFLSVKELWAYYHASTVNYYPDIYSYLILPLYAIILMLSAWLHGGYDRPVRIGRFVQGITTGAFILLIFYSLLDETMRYSRAILLLGSIASILLSLLARWVYNAIGIEGYCSDQSKRHNYIIIGDDEDYLHVINTFDKTGITPRTKVAIQPQDNIIDIIKSRIKHRRHWRIVFCTKSVGINQMINISMALQKNKIEFLTAPAYDETLISPTQIYNSELLYSEQMCRIATSTARRSKRITDITLSLLLLALSPLLIWWQRHPLQYIKHSIQVLFARRTWVGYSITPAMRTENNTPLPNLRKGVLTTAHTLAGVRRPDLPRLDNDYAMHYTTWKDITTVVRNWRRL